MTISGFAAYIKQAWKNKPDTSTPLSADRLLHIEDGIKGNSDAIAKSAAAVVNQIVNDPNKIASMAALFAVNQKVTSLNANYEQLNADFAARDISGSNLSLIARSGWYVGINIPEINAYGLPNAWYRIFANVQTDNSKIFLFASNEGKMYMGWIDAGQSAFRLVRELPSKDDLEYLEVVGDCNSAISTGKYVISNSGNAPCAYGFLDVKNAYTGRWLQQTATSTSGDIYVRHNTNSSGWTQWDLK